MPGNDNEPHAITSPAAQDGPLVRVRLLVAYDGSSFHGFALQRPPVLTVAGVLQEALERRLGNVSQLTCAGRTDAGVHAWGQVVTFDAPAARIGAIGVDRLQRSLNRQLNPAIVVRKTQTAPDNFDARRSALARRYRYSIWNFPVANPFVALTMWHLENPLDLGAMNAAVAAVVGEHDFSSFCRRPGEEISLIRRIHHAQWTTPQEAGGFTVVGATVNPPASAEVGQAAVVRFEVEAAAFCHQMVRSLVGQFVEIGLGKRPVSDMGDVLSARNRQVAAPLAPPQGLCLWEVLY